jgi:hypothetical protein
MKFQHTNIEIKTGENIKKQSQPVQELFLILDTSDSMAGGNRLVNAKLANENIIGNMNKNDKLHSIQYNITLIHQLFSKMKIIENIC